MVGFSRIYPDLERQSRNLEKPTLGLAKPEIKGRNSGPLRKTKVKMRMSKGTAGWSAAFSGKPWPWGKQPRAAAGWLVKAVTEQVWHNLGKGVCFSET
jgi:hypothetical protein